VTLGKSIPIYLSEVMKLQTKMKRYKKFVSREHESTLKTSFWQSVVQVTGGVGDCVVRVMTTLCAGRFGVRIPTGPRDFLFEKFRPGTTQSSTQWVPRFFPGVKAART